MEGLYGFRGKDSQGRPECGQIEAESESQALRLLRSDGLEVELLARNQRFDLPASDDEWLPAATPEPTPEAVPASLSSPRSRPSALAERAH